MTGFWRRPLFRIKYRPGAVIWHRLAFVVVILGLVFFNLVCLQIWGIK